MGPGRTSSRRLTATLRRPQTTAAATAPPGAPIREAEVATADPSLLERIGGILADVAAQISTADPPTTDGVRLGSDRGGGAREQESWSNAGRAVDGSHGYEDEKQGQG